MFDGIWSGVSDFLSSDAGRNAALLTGTAASFYGAYLQSQGMADAAERNAEVQRFLAEEGREHAERLWQQSRGAEGHAILPEYLGDFEKEFATGLTDIYGAQTTPGESGFSAQDLANQMGDQTWAQFMMGEDGSPSTWDQGNQFIADMFNGNLLADRQALVDRTYQDMWQGYDDIAANRQANINNHFAGQFDYLDGATAQQRADAEARFAAQQAGLSDIFGDSRSDINTGYQELLSGLGQNYDNSLDNLGTNYAALIADIEQRGGDQQSAMAQSYADLIAGQQGRYGSARQTLGSEFDSLIDGADSRIDDSRANITGIYESFLGNLQDGGSNINNLFSGLYDDFDGLQEGYVDYLARTGEIFDQYEGTSNELLDRNDSLNADASSARQAAINTSLGDNLRNMELSRMRRGLGGDSSFANAMAQAATIQARQAAGLGDVDDQRAALAERARVNELYMPARIGAQDNWLKASSDLAGKQADLAMRQADINGVNQRALIDAYLRYAGDMSGLDRTGIEMFSDAQQAKIGGLSNLQAAEIGDFNASSLGNIRDSNALAMALMQESTGALRDKTGAIANLDRDMNTNFVNASNARQNNLSSGYQNFMSNWNSNANDNQNKMGAIDDNAINNFLGLGKNQLNTQQLFDQGYSTDYQNLAANHASLTIGGHDQNASRMNANLDAPYVRAKQGYQMANLPLDQDYNASNRLWASLSPFDIGPGNPPYQPTQQAIFQPNSSMAAGAGLAGAGSSLLQWGLRPQPTGD